MRKHPLVEMSVHNFFAGGYTNSTSGGSGARQTDARGEMSLTLVGYFIIFVFTCIAVSHSNSDLIYSTCGHTLRDLLIADLVVSSSLLCFAFLLCCFGMCYVKSNSVSPDEPKSVSPVAIFVLSITATLLGVVTTSCLGAFTISESVIALQNSDCTSAMRNTDDGINSPSANLGSPLLAIMGIVQGVLYLSSALSLIIAFIVQTFTAIFFVCTGSD